LADSHVANPRPISVIRSEPPKDNSNELRKLMDLGMLSSGFHLICKDTGESVDLDSIAAIGAYKEAFDKGYKMNERYWIHNGERTPILFHIPRAISGD
jgi:hypothetical protein